MKTRLNFLKKTTKVLIVNLLFNNQNIHNMNTSNELSELQKLKRNAKNFFFSDEPKRLTIEAGEHYREVITEAKRVSKRLMNQNIENVTIYDNENSALFVINPNYTLTIN